MPKGRVRGTWPTFLPEVFTISGGPRAERWGHCSIETPHLNRLLNNLKDREETWVIKEMRLENRKDIW